MASSEAGYTTALQQIPRIHVRAADGLLLALVFLLCIPLASAGGSVGIDYVSSDLKVNPFGNQGFDLNSTGPGFSASLSVTENWSIGFSRSEQDGERSFITSGDTRALINVDSDTETTSLGISYRGDSFWLRFAGRRTEDNLVILGRGQNAGALELEDVQRADEFTVEIGKDWEFSNWNPSASLFLTRQSTDIEQIIRLDLLSLFTQEALREKLSGTAMGITGTLSYIQELSGSVLLVPSIGLQFQTNLSGEVNGETVVVLRNATRDVSAARGQTTSLSDDEELSGSLGVSLLVGDWMLSTGYFNSLSSDDTGDSWYVGLNYFF